MYADCNLCPRSCGADRLHGELGFCTQGPRLRAAWAGLHFGEEPAVSARGGSGAIFFSGCTLGCSFCQNYQLSHQGLGRELNVLELADLMLELQTRGAENVNLVTGTQFTPGIAAAIGRARERGLTIPLVWNYSGYERVETLNILTESIDLFLPDCKTLDPVLSGRLMAAPDYPEMVQAALLQMVQAKPLRFEADKIVRGLIVRHLVLPAFIDSSRQVLRWFRQNLYGKALLSLMFQFTPVEGRECRRDRPDRVPERRISKQEYEQIFAYIDELGIEEGFVQEMDSGVEWLPDFRKVNPFPDNQAVPVWPRLKRPESSI